MRSRVIVHRQRGFSLAEILVTTAIFAIIMIAALTVYDRSNRVFKTSAESADLQQSTRIGFDKLVSEVRLAGFDYNRGGIPSGATQYEQPDEQIEYAGASAIVFRANLDYTTNAGNGNGLAPDTYSAKNPTNGEAYFPYITTDNNEIVAYVLRATDNTYNTGSISFFVDSSIPRKAYPNTNGTAESTVTISGIDTSNDHPPYILYRVTAADAIANNLGTPVADNIRSMKFSYYTDNKGSTLLKNADGTDITASRNASGADDPAGNGTGAIGGAGQFDPFATNPPANFSDRAQRGSITSVRVSLTGMSANPDNNYVNPNEAASSPALHYRTYSLASLVVPRNLGLTGFPEPNYSPPGPPTITGVCTGVCAVPVVCWTPPTTGGPVVKYNIAWDASLNGSFQSSVDVNDPTASSFAIPDQNVMTPSTSYFFRVTAINDNGSSTPSGTLQATPLNQDKLGSPTLAVPSGGTGGPPAQPERIALQWTVPTTFAAANSSCQGTCTGTGTQIPKGELMYYKVVRGTKPDFDPASEGVTVLDFFTGVPQPNISATPGSTVNWVDAVGTSLAPPAACSNYYYRIQVASRCAKQDPYNNPSGAGLSISEFYPPPAMPALPGQASGNTTPSATQTLTVDANNSVCPAHPSPNCSITLKWSKVTTDTAGNAVAIDTYRITRWRKISSDPAFVLDPTYPPTDVTGYSQSQGGFASYVDTTGVAYDNSTPKNAYYYRYTVAAKICSTYGAESNTADYPTSCSFNPTIVASGAGGGSGDTITDPWIMNAGDTISITKGTLAFNTVRVTVSPYPSGNAFVDTGTMNVSSYVYGWVDQNQGMYIVTIIIGDGTCNETHTKYVEEQPPADCFFVALASQPPVSVANNGQSASMTFIITNDPGNPEAMQFNTTGFQGSASITWLDPDGRHHDMNMTSLQWGSGHFSKTDNFNLPGSGIGGSTITTTRSAPSQMPDIVAGGSFTVTPTFSYDGGGRTPPDPPLTTSPVTKLCIAYRIASEPGVTKNCNLVGKANPSANPGACD